MRATLRDVARHPSWFPNWWLEFAPRHRRWWGQLLFESGQGWLRWKMERREGWGGYYDPPEPYMVAPPLHRLWFHVRQRYWGDLGLKDDDREGDLWG